MSQQIKSIGKVLTIAAAAALVAVATIPVLLRGSNVATPNTFTNGQVADADEVNANFMALRNGTNDNDARIQVLESTIATLQARVSSLESELLKSSFNSCTSGAATAVGMNGGTVTITNAHLPAINLLLYALGDSSAPATCADAAGLATRIAAAKSGMDTLAAVPASLTQTQGDVTTLNTSLGNLSTEVSGIAGRTIFFAANLCGKLIQDPNLAYRFNFEFSQSYCNFSPINAPTTWGGAVSAGDVNFSTPSNGHILVHLKGGQQGAILSAKLSCRIDGVDSDLRRGSTTCVSNACTGSNSDLGFGGWWDNGFYYIFLGLPSGNHTLKFYAENGGLDPNQAAQVIVNHIDILVQLIPI